MLADGTWVFVLEGLLALILAVLIVWWTLPSKREHHAPTEAREEEKNALHDGTGEPSPHASDAQERNR